MLTPIIYADRTVSPTQRGSTDELVSAFSVLKGIIGMSDKKWHSGWPKEPGWYNCLLDGEMEMQLKYYVCQVAMKPHWVDANGDYIESMAHVQWSSKAEHER